jgi:hypothetical protein
MNVRSTFFNSAAACLLFGSFLLVGATNAQIVSHSRDIIVERPSSLPEFAQQPGVALQLYSGNGDGRTYLYIEQHRGERLLVLDVTDPAHTKQVGAVALSVPGPFDFVRPLGSTAILLSFRNNQGVAVLNLKSPKVPVLRSVNGLQFPGRTEPLGETGFLMVNERRVVGGMAPSDYQVVDASTPAEPVLLDTVKMVTNQVTREETGTTFLLGADGLTIIRRPRVEREYQIKQAAMKN